MTNYFWAVWAGLPDINPFIVAKDDEYDIYFCCADSDVIESNELIILEPVVPCKKKV